VHSKNTNRYVGVIHRKATHERQFGNFGAFEVSIGGKEILGNRKRSVSSRCCNRISTQTQTDS